jgi:hypothetical protein
MSDDSGGGGRSMPRDILITIAQFKEGNLRLSTFLDHTWAQIHDLAPEADVDVSALEDLWTDIEIIYAQASAARQSLLDDEQAEDVERIIDDMVSALGGAA